MRGRIPEPTAIKKLRGSYRADRRHDEPAVEISAPKMPSYLDEVAAAEWRRVVPLLLGMGVLAKTDRAMLEAYCVTYSNYRQLVAELSKPICHENPNAESDRKKLNNDLLKTSKLMLDLAREFGLSPSSRTRIKVNPSAVEYDAFDKLNKRDKYIRPV